jgi:hypothetical protein
VLADATDNEAVKRLAQDEAERTLACLEDRASDDGLTGYDATGWEAKIWIVHAMYETDELPSGITHDDVRRLERAAGLRKPKMIGEVDLEEVLDDAVLIGSSLGASGWPGPDWHRLLWSELAARLGTDPYDLDVPPGIRSFPYSSWPANIAPPAEGSLDRDQFVRVLDQLADASDDGHRASCFAYYSPVACGVFDELTVFRCELGELMALYDAKELSGSPSNVWPDDKSWLVYTDSDLWATKVSGGRELIDRLLDDDEIETVVLDF